MTLYLKYRPQKVDELDLESVRETLGKIISSSNIPHGFLFSGPKGTGKTSSARILAKVINCEKLKNNEPCNECEVCLSITKGTNIDVIELDGASNRGIDDARALKETVNLAPSSLKKKIYIIDEAHMLTTEAANALLKTLEEPPSHVVFILATTNPEKLPITVRSRLVNVNFQKATAKEIGRQLARVAKGEKLKVDDEAALEIAKASDGSFRDAVKILESLSWKTKNIKKTDVLEFLSNSTGNVNELLLALKNKDSKSALIFIENLVTNGASIKSFLDEVIMRLHNALLAKSGIAKEDLKDFEVDEVLNLLELFSKSRSDLNISVLQELPIEIAVIKYCGNAEAPKKKSHSAKASRDGLVKDEISDELWKKLLETVRSKNASIEALLRSAKIMGREKDTMVIGVYYKFHKERLETPVNRRMIEEVVGSLTGDNSLKVSYELTERPAAQYPTPQVNSGDTLTETHNEDIIEAAKEIFS